MNREEKIEKLMRFFLLTYTEVQEDTDKFLEGFDDPQIRTNFLIDNPILKQYVESHTKEELSKTLSYVALAYATAVTVVDSQSL